MTHAASISRPGSEFDAFLFALIWEDRNGLPVSVISALARMNLDPWREAAALAALPAETAGEKVSALFRALPEGSLSDRDRDTMVTRLTALLPRAVDSETRSPEVAAYVGNPNPPRPGTNAILFGIYMLLLLATQFIMARHVPHGEPAQPPSSRSIPSPASAPARLPASVPETAAPE